MRRLPIDLDEVAEALTSHVVDCSWYLDTDTGRVFLLDNLILESVEDGDIDELPAEDLAIARSLLSDEPRYLLVVDPGWDPYQVMDEFVETVDDDELVDSLNEAIASPEVFRELLEEHPRWHKRWEEFEEQRGLEAARQWLSEQDIEPLSL
ncbi:MAG: hypothetical protein KC910_23280 [Candidatus Eremiobacteraeota bacterium]|nr:hypothetical protein [Candidatus Eremiobacteraeota bacterium]